MWDSCQKNNWGYLCKHIYFGYHHYIICQRNVWWVQCLWSDILQFNAASLSWTCLVIRIQASLRWSFHLQFFFANGSRCSLNDRHDCINYLWSYQINSKRVGIENIRSSLLIGYLKSLTITCSVHFSSFVTVHLYRPSSQAQVKVMLRS